MGWESTAPQVLAALRLALVTITLDGEVRYGPQTGDISANEVITIGYIPPDDDNSAEASNEPGGMGPRQRESYTIHNAIAVATGNTNPDTPIEPSAIQETTTRAFALLAQVGQRLAADPTLGRTCMKARITSWSLREDLASGGPRAELRFDVGVEAFTNP